MSGPRLPRSRYFFCVALSLCLGTWLLFHHLTYDSTTLARASEVKHQSYESHDEAQKILTTESNTSRLVPLEAHIMSKCPDARDCLRDLVVPAMEKVVDMVDFNLSFIGKYEIFYSCPFKYAALRYELCQIYERAFAKQLNYGRNSLNG